MKMPAKLLTKQPKERREFPPLNAKGLKDVTRNEDEDISHPELTRRYLADYRQFCLRYPTNCRLLPVKYTIDGEEFLS